MEADDGQRNIPEGKSVDGELMKRARAANRETEDQTGALGPMSETR